VKTATALVVLLCVVLGVTVAQEANRRVITVSAPGGSVSGNLVHGPRTYVHPEPGGVKATVSNLEIAARRAVVAAPEGVPLSQAEGRRTVVFSEGVTVLRGAVTATGLSLEYAEETGVGDLTGQPEMVQRPRDPGGDEVRVTADSLRFDVDTDISRSSGAVRLINGPQRGAADLLYYEEDARLAVLRGTRAQVRMTRDRPEGALVILATEARVLTADEVIWASGRVRLEDGDAIVEGDQLFYDDATGIAIVIGTTQPARSRDGGGNELTGGTLRRDTRAKRVEQLATPFRIPTQRFETRERP
jgi:lipopolysaccharide export system protein LptA